MRRQWKCLCLLVLVAAGCGEPGAPDRPPPAETTTRPAREGPSVALYRKRVAAICRDVDRRVQAIARPDDPRRLAGYLRRVLAVGRPALERLAAVRPPPALAARARRAITLARRELRLVEEAAGALQSSADPTRAYAPFQRRLDALLAREDAAWRRLGVPGCAEENPPPAAAAPPI